MPNVSQLEERSIGIVAVNKPRSTTIIEVTLAEVTPFLDGEITDNADVSSVQGSAADGKAFDVKLRSTGTVKARWLPFGSNRATPPDVRRGMKVRVFQFGDEDEYYWSALGDDENLFKLETAIFKWSGNGSEDQPNDASNCYYLEINTHDGLVAFHTSDKNGEFGVWDVQINTKESILVIRDSLANFITMETKTGHIEAQNFKGTYFKMVGKDISANAPGETNWTCPMTNWTGDFKLKGNFTLTGNYSQTGNMAIKGDFAVEGNGSVSGIFSAGKVNSTQPISAPNV